MASRSTKIGIVLLVLAAFVHALTAGAQSSVRIGGSVFDPEGRPVAGAHVEFASNAGEHSTATTGAEGSFTVTLPAWGAFTVRVEAEGFAPVARDLRLDATSGDLQLRLDQLAATAEEVVVAGGVNDVSLASPDPSQKVLVREELLDANPGRPGAPLSIPGLPIETASGGIKAPQYFVPGVAGDHGEPIAQYIAVGDYLVSNNLSANAHGNGYADPNIFIAAALGSVETDGGAFNVLEGNHSLNLAAAYSLRPQLKRFATLTSDYRDLDLVAGFAPSNSPAHEWVALEAGYGNGLWDRLEHRQQYKWNALRDFSARNHEVTLFSIGYYGTSYVGGLVPLGFAPEVRDTIDPRQRDQTHTAILAANDRWKAGANDELSFSGFFRTYNLALFSNFGEGLIRQSEFRTVGGAEARLAHTITPWLQAMAGVDYNEDDPRRDNLDHYLSANPQVYGPFVKVLANNLKIRDIAPYAALHGDLGKHVRLYAGLRPDRIEMKNTDLLKPADSFDLWKGFLNPKATLAWTPGTSRWLPSAAFSIGQAFFTEDPRIGVAPGAASGASALASPFERSHSEQLVLEKAFSATDVRITLGRTTTTATLAKIDPDNGLPQDLGPGNLKFLTASIRRQFSFGSLQGVFSKADARLAGTATTPGMVTPEAPRTIFDALAAIDRLPGGLRARGEYEYVGHKLLDGGGFEAVPVGETRVAMVRPLLNGRLELGANGLLGRGYTGQTTETFAPNWQIGDPPPACAPGVSGVANDFDCGTVERSVGVRLPSYVGASISWRFGAEK
ncbi:MAG: TonB-dependent receptor [Terracidiphilus sp.]